MDTSNRTRTVLICSVGLEVLTLVFAYLICNP